MGTIFTSINYWAVFVAAIVYWFLGAIWFSSLGTVWTKELDKHGIRLPKPTKAGMIVKFVITFILNFLIAWAVALVIHGLGIATVGAAIGWGLILGIGISAFTIGMAYLWESRSLLITLIDVGYPIIGIVISSIILTLWR